MFAEGGSAISFNNKSTRGIGKKKGSERKER